MDTLTKLTFEDFQSLQHTELDLDPGLNVIVGPSNLGKSAAIRGLRALVRNASATGLVREGAKEMRVGAQFANGVVETLTKGKGISQFELHFPDGQSILHAKAGANEIPPEVEALWSISNPDKRELTFATQHEPPFLLAEPASAVAKVLGDLTNASMLMEAVSKANKLRTAALADAKARHREAEEARDELITHAGISARGKALQAAREAYEFTQEKVAHWQMLVQFSDVFTKLEQEQKVNDEVLAKNLNVADLINKADAAVNTLRELEELQDKHEGLVSQLWQANTGIENNKSKIEQTNKKITELLEQAGVCPVCGSKTC